mmetsp:Transcript_73860/g.233282  ORF Transcript_73860/g.233282 Transcript_73860/m.233282 type:complete len:238 (-) Transcript_73860:112-825(-)
MRPDLRRDAKLQLHDGLPFHRVLPALVQLHRLERRSGRHRHDVRCPAAGGSGTPLQLQGGGQATGPGRAVPRAARTGGCQQALAKAAAVVPSWGQRHWRHQRTALCGRVCCPNGWSPCGRQHARGHSRRGRGVCPDCCCAAGAAGHAGDCARVELLCWRLPHERAGGDLLRKIGGRVLGRPPAKPHGGRPAAPRPGGAGGRGGGSCLWLPRRHRRALCAGHRCGMSASRERGPVPRL